MAAGVTMRAARLWRRGVLTQAALRCPGHADGLAYGQGAWVRAGQDAGLRNIEDVVKHAHH